MPSITIQISETDEAKVVEAIKAGVSFTVHLGEGKIAFDLNGDDQPKAICESIQFNLKPKFQVNREIQ